MGGTPGAVADVGVGVGRGVGGGVGRGVGGGVGAVTAERPGTGLHVTLYVMS